MYVRYTIQLQKKLYSRCRRPEEAASCLNYLYHFAMEWNRISLQKNNGTDHTQQPIHPADPRTLEGTQVGLERAYEAFENLKKRQGWSSHHLREVRVRLSRALACTVESLAPVVNPNLRRQSATTFFAPHSHRSHFTLHECLPIRAEEE